MKVILASGSPRRVELLTKMGIPFTQIVLDTDETVEGKTSERVQELARRKAMAVAATLSEGIVIGADTLVCVDDMPLGKPKDIEKARAMLRRLSGTHHYVYTGVCVVNASTGESEIRYDSSEIIFKELTDSMIEDYLDTKEYIGKAGAYAIQGLGGRFVEGYNGSYSNIVGLPIEVLTQMLKRYNI